MQIENQIRELTEHLRGGIRQIKGVDVAGPSDWACSSGISTLQLLDGTPEKCHKLIAHLLDDYRIVVKFRPEICGVRVTLAAFNTLEEVDRLLRALSHLVPLPDSACSDQECCLSSITITMISNLNRGDTTWGINIRVRRRVCVLKHLKRGRNQPDFFEHFTPCGCGNLFPFLDPTCNALPKITASRQTM